MKEIGKENRTGLCGAVSITLIAAAFFFSAIGQTLLQTEALTDYPLEIGGKVLVESEQGIRLNTSLGFLPSFYMQNINAICVGMDAYDQKTADLLLIATQSSLVWRTHVGWRPFRRHGLYGEIGYGLIGLGGAAASAELISIASGVSIPENSSEQDGYTVSSTLSMIDFEIGWHWELQRRMTVRLALGYTKTLGASTVITPENDVQMPNFISEPTPREVFAKSAEEYLNDIYTSYVSTPVISIAVGFNILKPSRNKP